jgi:aspartate 1-decarboxylase
MSTAEARVFKPRIVHVDSANRIIDVGTEPAAAIAPGLTRPPFAALR